MKIIIIENREKTYFWNSVFSEENFDEFEISWIVQNPLFNVNLKGFIHTIEFPAKKDLRNPNNEFNLVTDRGRDYFNSGDSHYAYYYHQIFNIIRNVNPDIVVGESTLFHELITIKVCRTLGVPFIHPVSERYPQRRFAVFSADTQIPAVFSGDILNGNEALALSQRIFANNEILNYLPSTRWQTRVAKKMAWFLSRYRVILGRLSGEKYNTPSLLQKWRLAKKRDANLKIWDKYARLPQDVGNSILYPMQMQPENTIDVWGRGHHDQTKIIQDILESCNSEVSVCVKANPKPYYELSDNFMRFCVAHPRVILLPRSLSMVDAMQLTVGAITITGTVGFEAACGRGRCISLMHPILTDKFPSFAAPNVQEATRRLLYVPSDGRGSVEIGAKLMQSLTARSFAGYISDPVSDPTCLTHSNVSLVAKGLKDAILQSLSENPTHRSANAP